MQPLFSATDIVNSLGMTGRGLPMGMGRPEESANDFDDADEEIPPPGNRDIHWWRDFGADFDDDEPEPEPGDFWPESDDT